MSWVIVLVMEAGHHLANDVAADSPSKRLRERSSYHPGGLRKPLEPDCPGRVGLEFCWRSLARRFRSIGSSRRMHACANHQRTSRSGSVIAAVQLRGTVPAGAVVDSKRWGHCRHASVRPWRRPDSALPDCHKRGPIAGSESETVQVDNDPVVVSLRTVNDPSPTAWVDHAVTVDATASAGPSGIELTDCQVDGFRAQHYLTQGLTLDGDGVHMVSCTAWNSAVNPHGLHNQGTASIAVHVDEAPPIVRFEPRTAGDPTELVVDATDDESGVAGGSIQLAPAGNSNWVNLPTSFDGVQLTAQLDDGQRQGSYVLRAAACDNAGNCGSATQAITLPLRTVPNFEVSLRKIVDPVRRRVIYKRVLVGWHWATIHRDGRSVRVKRGGHFSTIRVVEIIQQCTTRRGRVPPHGSAAARHLTRISLRRSVSRTATGSRSTACSPQLKACRFLGSRLASWRHLTTTWTPSAKSPPRRRDRMGAGRSRFRLDPRASSAQ